MKQPCIIAVLLLSTFGASATDLRDDHSPSNPVPRFMRLHLEGWLSGLASANGPCGDVSVARKVEDHEWTYEFDAQGGHYRVRIDGHWLDVSEGAIVTDHNRFGPPVAWLSANQVKCFMPATDSGR